MKPHRLFDPLLLDAIEQSVGEWSGTAYRQVFEGTDVLRANIRGGRWNPPEVEAVYCSLDSRTATAEVDHLIARQPVPIRTPRVTHLLSIALASVADLRDLATLESSGITSGAMMGEDLSVPQLVGGAGGRFERTIEYHAPFDHRCDREEDYRTAWAAFEERLARAPREDPIRHREEPPMIRRVRVANFKRFRDQSFDLADSVVLAGPNNSGKSTLMQAIAWWKEALDLWTAKREDAPRSERRTGVGVNRLSCNSAPVRDLNLLWNDRIVAAGNGPDRNRLMEIAVEGVTEGKPWECALEFHYAHPELAYVRPLGAREMADAELDAFPPPPAAELEVVRVPALAGMSRCTPPG